MTTPRHLTNAPIIEGLVDIQGIFTRGTPDEWITALRSHATSLSSEFPNRQDTFSRAVAFGLQGNLTATTPSPEGFVCRDAANSKVVQFRKNGFTFSKLRPYSNWEDLLGETKKYWTGFSNIGKSHGFVVTRIAARFINQLEITLPTDCKHISGFPHPLTTPPEPSAVINFTEQVNSIDSSTGASVNCIRAFSRINTDKANMVIDIDVYRELGGINIDSPDYWTFIDTFRDVKNRVFFGAVEESLISRYA